MLFVALHCPDGAEVGYRDYARVGDAATDRYATFPPCHWSDPDTHVVTTVALYDRATGGIPIVAFPVHPFVVNRRDKPVLDWATCRPEWLMKSRSTLVH